MRTWIPIILLVIAVTGLCIWDNVNMNNVFDKMMTETKAIYTTLVEEDTISEELKDKVFSLNKYWTKEVDTLCLSISKKDLQPTADYLQYLHCAMINDSREDAITYARLLSYNIEGLNEANGINILNLL